MTKQEELRMCLLNVEFDYSEIERSDIGTFYLTNSGLEKMLSELVALGAVLTVERELPCGGDEYNNINTKSPDYRNAVNDMLNAGWKATESLIGE